MVTISRSTSLHQSTFTFLVCLLISFMLWLLVRLSGDFQGSITMRMTFENLPEAYTLVDNNRPKVEINMEAQGFEMIAVYTRMATKSLKVNLEKYRIRRTREASRYVIPLLPLVQNELKLINGKVDRLDCSPDTLLLVIERKKK